MDYGPHLDNFHQLSSFGVKLVLLVGLNAAVLVSMIHCVSRGFNKNLSVISKSFVITAAHCIIKKETVRDVMETAVVVVGEVERAKVNSGNSIYIKSKKLIPHEHYDNINYKPHNDIGLIQLAKDVTITSNVKIAQLPFQYYPDDVTVVMVGWGQIENQAQSNYLMYGFMQLNKDCKQQAGGDSKAILCVSGILSAPCPGDSGGASFLGSSNIIVGVVVQNVNNKITGECLLKQIYTDVSVYYHLNWIKGKMQ